MLKKIKKWRKDKYNSWLMDAILLLMFIILLTWWQGRDALAAAGQPAPGFELTALEGGVHDLKRYQGKQVLLYFFAPWCSICRLSADNLNDLRESRSEEDLVILMMALSYDDVSEVREFVTDLDLGVPVLLGTAQQSEDYQIMGFPTYYVLDQDGRLASRSIGYSTEIGMRLRTW